MDKEGFQSSDQLYVDTNVFTKNLSAPLYNGQIYIGTWKVLSRDIQNHEKQVFSQNGEDGVLEFIFDKIGMKI